MIRIDNTVKRTDLDLRCYSIGLETEVYQTEEHRHVIYCKNYEGDFNELCDYFNNSIRPIGFWIELIKERPTSYITKLDNIPFSDVVNGFKGAYITMPDVKAAIIDRFPDVEIYNIKVIEGIDFEIIVEIASDTPLEKIKEMKEALLEIDLGTDKVEVCVGEKKEEPPEMNVKHPLMGMFEVSQLGIDKRLPFTVDEADFWFENASDIYGGRLTRKDMPKFYEKSTSCFIDFSIFDNLNLRNVLLLYDVVYLALPIADDFNKFIETQNVTRTELIQLAEMGKVIFVLNNLENRYDMQLLIDAYKCNSLSVIGRRGINTIIAAFLSETKEKFLSHIPHALEFASDLYKYAKKNENSKLLGLAHFLAWPVTGTIGSFKMLNSHGPLGYGVLGFDDMLIPILKELDKELIDNIRFSISVEGNKSFMASALNATLFPNYLEKYNTKNSPSFINRFISDLLQVYWYNMNSLSDIEAARNEALQGNHAVSLFDCKENVSITKVASLAEEYNTHDGFRHILLDLGRMSEQERKNKVKLYNDLLFDIASAKPDKSKIDFVLSATAFLPLPYIASIVIGAISGIKGKISTTKNAQAVSHLKTIEKCIEEAGLQVNTQLVEDVYLLDKISRVASLR